MGTTDSRVIQDTYVTGLEIWVHLSLTEMPTASWTQRTAHAMRAGGRRAQLTQTHLQSGGHLAPYGHPLWSAKQPPLSLTAGLSKDWTPRGLCQLPLTRPRPVHVVPSTS